MTIQHFPVIAVMGLFLGAFLVELFGSRNKLVRNIIALTAASVAFVLIAALIKPVMFDGQIISYWMGGWEPVSGYAIGIGYEIDGLSLFFAMMAVTTILLSGVYSIRYMERDGNLGHYYTLYLLLSGGVLGFELTGDLFNLFVMLEIITFAASALTAFRNRRVGTLEAGFKYLVMGSIGSAAVLLGVTLIYMQCHTLNMAQVSAALAGSLTPTTVLAFALMLSGFCLKSFIVPFHAPVADAYMSAPTSISMFLAGTVNKAGVYGMIRLCGIIFRVMDKGSVQILLVALGTITMFVGVTMALAQHDFKRLLAFHSISQIGYGITAVGLGTALGVTGGLFHALNHTLFKGLLFLCAGTVLYAAGTTDLDKLGGLSKRMPKTAICFLVGAFSISGLPPFNGFASKWIIYQAAYTKAVETGNFFYAVVTVTAVVVSVMTLASFIKVTQAVFFGQLPDSCREVKEVPLSMRIPMWIMSALCLLTGLFYKAFNAGFIAPAVRAVLSPASYIDRMMGEGVAAASGITDAATAPVAFSYWDPIMWLVLFAVVLAAVGIVAVAGQRNRGRTLRSDTSAPSDSKYATFFGGEKSLHSHVSGSDLFWGFRHELRGYFRFAQGMHTGSVNDYALWVVTATAVIILFASIFIR